MGLSTLLTIFAGTGMLLTLVTVLFKRHNQMWMTFLQHFCGVWFVFSGYVKAVDPIGTAYKMEEYFDNFATTFEGTSFSFLAPIFPWLNGFGNGFAIFMIVLEIILGLMLIFGIKRKLTAWLFFLLVLFFTFLTGFTYLTGFVPSDANFFEFSKWGSFVKSQMRVTDCGCFGDFIKLDPRVSFYKDVFLLLPAGLFLFFTNKMHQLWQHKGRLALGILSTLAVGVFCFSNTYWQEPIVDFRPFSEGTNIRLEKTLEEEARNNVDIIGWLMENDSLGKIVEVMEPDYMIMAKDYPKDKGWKVKDQIQTEPGIIQVTGYEIFNPATQEAKTVPAKSRADLMPMYPDSVWQVRKELGAKIPYAQTKISDFSVTNLEDGSDFAEQILNEEGYTMLIVAYHFEGTEKIESFMVQDTSWATDTLQITKDSFALVPRVEAITPVETTKATFTPDAAYNDIFTKKINPLALAAEKAGWKVHGLASVQDQDRVEDLRFQTQSAYPFHIGDDKLLKTMMRSNPGVIIMKDGVILKKYHHRHIPTTLPY